MKCNPPVERDARESFSLTLRSTVSRRHSQWTLTSINNKILLISLFHFISAHAPCEWTRSTPILAVDRFARLTFRSSAKDPRGDKFPPNTFRFLTFWRSTKGIFTNSPSQHRTSQRNTRNNKSNSNFLIFSIFQLTTSWWRLFSPRRVSMMKDVLVAIFDHSMLVSALSASREINKVAVLFTERSASS